MDGTRKRPAVGPEPQARHSTGWPYRLVSAVFASLDPLPPTRPTRPRGSCKTVVPVAVVAARIAARTVGTADNRAAGNRIPGTVVADGTEAVGTAGTKVSVDMDTVVAAAGTVVVGGPRIGVRTAATVD